MENHMIRNQTVNLIGKLLHPLTESNLIPFPEYREIIAQLRHLANKGEPLPDVVPKLITMEEAAEMLGISLANFKKQEPYLPFKRKYVGHGVRYRNTDVIRFILSDDGDTASQSVCDSEKHFTRLDYTLDKNVGGVILSIIDGGCYGKCREP